MSARAVVKHIIERGIILTGATHVARRRRRGDALILAYHNIVPAGASPVGDCSLHLPQAAFAAQLDMVARTHDVVPLMDLLTPTQHDSDRPRIAITFDDAYYGAMTAGVRELQQRRLPATMFVAPAYLGGHSFWWDTCSAADGTGLDPVLREEALTTYAGQEHEIHPWAERSGIPEQEVPAHAACADEATLDEALRLHPGLTYGAHTWSHPNLTRLSANELASELRTPREWLTRFGTRTVPVISYPYGCANDMVWRAADAAGYAAGLMIDGGWMTETTDNRFALPRLNVPAGISADGFALRIAGVLS